MEKGSNEPKSRYLKYLEVITGTFEDKKRWRQYKARIKTLPESYRTAADALERYLLFFGPGDGADMASMFEDLADLFEQSAANGTPIREIFGEDPVEFVEEFLKNYPAGRWISRERERFTSAIAQAAGEDTGNEGGTRS